MQITLSGKITDFAGNPYPATVTACLHGFDCGISVQSDAEGNYSLTLPKGLYNAIYVCDDGYGKTVLENWSWHVYADRDERHDFKIGNGEVYGLSAWSNNGGFSTLFIYFRPMVLPSLKSKEYCIQLNGKKFGTTDICPDLAPDDLTVTMNGRQLEIVSLQKIYETGDNTAMPAYILQVTRPPVDLQKQTLTVEYDAPLDGGCRAQSQGRMQFFFKDNLATTTI